MSKKRKLISFDDDAKDTLDEWINFLKNETISDDSKAKGLLQAKETLDYLNMPDDERLDYDRREENLRREASIYEGTYIAGGIEGHKQGHKEGVEQRNIEIAKNLLDVLDDETISSKTGLPSEFINSLR